MSVPSVCAFLARSRPPLGKFNQSRARLGVSGPLFLSGGRKATDWLEPLGATHHAKYPETDYDVHPAE